ncbi:hypothetical protein B0H66DRAFT_558178 [Apodospora peruviana]|uniref:Ankyrin repeat protein n=1 Tax=Apodospora peruviana TaxID=516989 RepID=A0AAE0I542_9PEZI|nr:hypothetical protein B0H66DRAFT_558178 [Apodospora peruviana]
MEQMTPLMDAAAANITAATRLLIESGAKMEALNKLGITALFYTIRSNSHGPLAILLEAGADHRHISIIKGTILRFVALTGDIETMRILADLDLEGVDAGFRDRAGLTVAQVFGQRTGVTDELREAFLNLVARNHSVSFETLRC